ncbi:MarR family winged helix-turn-helix transcriptional regulator [Paracoccus laeviglucosivorans]|uniref:DNA-binding transcriptional regulator, MarR family n=1 Tax=Paracoccus laeviglucosivorans TaxID=1197861 RepID=A0A521F680_9RHOB|nr:MarR family winged helix-turn-helix transcriptional regulator [Paracoccus laeviglucosivorans]SMO91715.1 DNA-binding transcriptional regulator, MarR family [Paracoccus laeviglucosivorans]
MHATLTPAQGQSQFGDDDPKIAYNRVFFALLRIQRSLMPEIEKSLRVLGIADPIWYEILYAVEQSGANGVQMLALQKRLAVPQYALSRHVTRMEKAGLIRRQAAAGVGRGQNLHLTAKSQGLHDRIWQVYVARIQAAIGPHMSTDEAYDLVRSLNKLYP